MRCNLPLTIVPHVPHLGKALWAYGLLPSFTVYRCTLKTPSPLTDWGITSQIAFLSVTVKSLAWTFEGGILLQLVGEARSSRSDMFFFFFSLPLFSHFILWQIHNCNHMHTKKTNCWKNNFFSFLSKLQTQSILFKNLPLNIRDNTTGTF